MTQTLVVYSIRTRRVPFLRSRPSRALTATTLLVVAVAVYLPLSPLAHTFGFVAPSIRLYLAITVLAALYLVLVDAAKTAVFAAAQRRPAPAKRERRVHKRISRFTATTPTVFRGRARTGTEHA